MNHIFVLGILSRLSIHFFCIPHKSGVFCPITSELSILFRQQFCLDLTVIATCKLLFPIPKQCIQQDKMQITIQLFLFHYLCGNLKHSEEVVVRVQQVQVYPNQIKIQ